MHQLAQPGILQYIKLPSNKFANEPYSPIAEQNKQVQFQNNDGQQYENDETNHLLQILNVHDKGSDCIVIHPGSDSLKLGLASQFEPFVTSMAIAYPKKNSKDKSQEQTTLLGRSWDKVQRDELQMQQIFEQELSKSIHLIEADLRKKKYMTIDAKSEKNIRMGQVSYQVFDQTNYQKIKQERKKQYSDRPIPELNSDQEILAQLRETDYDLDPEEFEFTDYPEMRLGSSSDKPILIGEDALNLHKDEDYIVRRPIKHGNLNVCPQYSYQNQVINEAYDIKQCVQDLETIIVRSIEKDLKISQQNLKHFNCILIIPDICIKIHIRMIINMLFNLGFKSMMIHQESVLASYAMAVPSACVVDIGASKTTVCCIDEGIMIQKSIIKKHYGGNEQTELFLRLLQSQSYQLHYFPPVSTTQLTTSYNYHNYLIQHLKHKYSTFQMQLQSSSSSSQLIHKENLPIKSQQPSSLQSNQIITHISFNLSTIPLLTTQSIFYTSLIQCVQSAKQIIQPKTVKYCQDQEEFFDSEDVVIDILQNMVEKEKLVGNIQGQTSGNMLSNPVIVVNKGEQMTKDLAEASHIQVNLHQVYNEVMDIDEMVCRSLYSIDNQEMRTRMSQNIILVGGVSRAKGVIEMFEQSLISRIQQCYEKDLKRVEVILCNLQQQQQYLLQQQTLAGQNNNNQEMLLKFKQDPRFLSWIGGSVICKLDGAKDMFIQRSKYFRGRGDTVQESWNQQFSRIKEDKIQGFKKELQQKNEQNQIDVNMNDFELSRHQEQQIEADVTRKLKRDRGVEGGGMKLIREKVPFNW